MKSLKDMKTDSGLTHQEVEARLDRLLKEQERLEKAGKVEPALTLKELKELGISTAPTMVISFNQKKR